MMSTRKAWYVVALCMVGYVFSFVDRQILSLLIGPIQADLGISDTQFGLLHGLAFSLFYATMGLPIAATSDRVSRPLVITLGIAVWSVATMACGLARTFVQLFVARVAVGAGEAALSPAAYSLIADLFPREKLGRAYAVYSIGSFIGAGLAFLVGGSVIALADRIAPGGWSGLRPWQLVFFVVGAPGLALTLVFALSVREPRQGRDASGRTPVPFVEVARFLARQRHVFVPHMIGFNLMAMSLFALLGWSPAYLMRTFHLVPQQAGLWLGTVALVAGGGGVLTCGWIMDAMLTRGHGDAPFRTGILGAVGTVLPAIALPFATSLPMGAALLGIALFFASFPMPTSTAVMQILTPPAMRSRVSAIFLFLNSFVGLTLGSLLVGLLNDHVFGSAAAVGTSVAVVVAVASSLAAIVLGTGGRPYASAVARLDG